MDALDSCCICFEEFDAGCANNKCTTSCGHMFHTGCLLQNAVYRDECPMCRTELIKSSDDEDDDDADDDYDDDEESDDDEEEGDNDVMPNITVHQIANKMKDLGYSMEDMIVMIMDVVTHEKDKQNKKWEDIDHLRSVACSNLFKIQYGDISVDYRDGRSYAQVVAQRS